MQCGKNMGAKNIYHTLQEANVGTVASDVSLVRTLFHNDKVLNMTNLKSVTPEFLELMMYPS